MLVLAGSVAHDIFMAGHLHKPTPSSQHSLHITHNLSIPWPPAQAVHSPPPEKKKAGGGSGGVSAPELSPNTVERAFGAASVDPGGGGIDRSVVDGAFASVGLAHIPDDELERRIEKAQGRKGGGMGRDGNDQSGGAGNIRLDASAVDDAFATFGGGGTGGASWMGVVGGPQTMIGISRCDVSESCAGPKP